jgi:hypothetical protein
VRLYLEKPFRKIGFEEWFKVKALSSSPSTAKKKKKRRGKSRRPLESNGTLEVSGDDRLA